MEFQINTNNVILIQQDQVESGEYNVTECNFIFSSKYEGLTKKAVFTGEDGTAYLQTIVDNKCSIPSEILEVSQVVQIGVYAYAVENEELILRYSPEPTDFFIHEGSYKEAQNSTPPTPSEIEQLQAQITTNANNIEELQECCGKYDSDIAEIKAEQITQNTSIHNNADNIETINEQISDINETITNLETNKANVTDLNALTERVSTNERDIDTIDGHISDINQNIDDLEQDLTNYSLITETGSQIELNINSSDFKLKAILKDKNGNTIYTSNIIDLPLETMVVGASYDNVTKEVVLTLQNGTTLRFSVADLVEGLVSTDQLTQILSNYYNKNEVNNLLNAKANQTSLDTTNQNLTTLTGRVSTNEEDIVDIKEEQITQNTNIEELQNQVETLQEDLDNANSEIEELTTDITNMRKASYKVDGQGTDITLENTSDNKFVELGLNGNTEQEQLSGKNLFDNSVINNLWVTTNGDIATNNSASCLKYNCLSGDAYTISASFEDTGSSNIIVIAFYDENDGMLSRGVAVGSSNKEITLTKTAPENTAYMYAGHFTKIPIKIQLEKNSTATSYEPYCGGIPSPNPDFPQQIKNVTGQANVKIQNKNLFDKNNFEYVNGKRLDDNGEVVSDANSSYSITLFEVKPNTAYTIQGTQSEGTKTTRIYYYNNQKQFISRTRPFATDSYSFTTLENCNYIGLQLRNSEYINVNIIQLEEGTTATSYVEHQEQNYPFTFAQSQRGMQGTQPKDDGIHNRHKQRVLDGTETFWNITMAGDIPCFWFRNLDIGAKNNPHNKKCNYFIYSSLGFRNAEINTLCENESSIPLFIFKTNIANSIETWKQWLAEQYANGTPVIVEYELVEEEIIPYNATQQAQYNAIKEAISYYKQTNISGSSSELSPIITASAVGDLNLILDTMQSKIDLLEG